MYATSESRKQSAVARVLGPDMLQEIQRSSGNARSRYGAAGGVNVEVLLNGAERLCAVYPVAGASEKIASLRSRHRNIADSIAHHEEKVAKQQARLNKVNKASDYVHSYEDEVEKALLDESAEKMATEQDLEAEEQEIRELEAKKRALEERVSGIEKDLGGLLR
jgi:septal ring factor EnvC (AmiA/AmiB activator)